MEGICNVPGCDCDNALPQQPIAVAVKRGMTEPEAREVIAIQEIQDGKLITYFGQSAVLVGKEP
jgi:hypothetical protein